MISKTLYAILPFCLCLVWACRSDRNAAKTESSESALSKNGITLVPVSDSPQFPHASLRMHRLRDTGQRPGKVVFDFELENFYLTQITPDTAQKACANDPRGQHIRHSLNGAPPKSYYIDTASQVLPEGHYASMAFLARSYGESVKDINAVVLHQFNVGKPANGQDFDLTRPLLFYNQPQGEYKGNDTRRILLDFFLINTDLQKDGNRVEATINGTSFVLDRWTAYFIEGLPDGETSIRLSLLDPQGKPINSTYNTAAQTIRLQK